MLLLFFDAFDFLLLLILHLGAQVSLAVFFPSDALQAPLYLAADNPAAGLSQFSMLCVGFQNRSLRLEVWYWHRGAYFSEVIHSGLLA